MARISPDARASWRRVAGQLAALLVVVGLVGVTPAHAAQAGATAVFTQVGDWYATEGGAPNLFRVDVFDADGGAITDADVYVGVNGWPFQEVRPGVDTAMNWRRALSAGPVTMIGYVNRGRVQIIEYFTAEVTVLPATATATVALSTPSVVPYGELVHATVDVEVDGEPAQGYVNLRTATSSLGVAQLVHGRAEVITAPPAVGTHQITARYQGGAGAMPASSAPTTITVEAAPPKPPPTPEPRGTDSLGVLRGSLLYLTNGVRGGTADTSILLLEDFDAMLIGDWDGDGLDTGGLRRGNRYALSTWQPFFTPVPMITFGRASDIVISGDWDGDGKDSLGVRRGNRYYLSNTTAGGAAEIEFTFGRAADAVVVGDWDGDGKDTLSVRRGNRYFLSNTTKGGAAEVEFTFGRADDAVLVGDWDGR